MTKLSELSDALSKTLANSDLEGVTVELAEAVSDAFFEDGLAKDIPIIGMIFRLSKLGVSVRDRLFVKKITCFLSVLAHVSAEQRAEMISKIERSEKYRIKVGEQLLYILDKSEDHEDSRIVAYLFNAYVSGELSYDDFLRASRAIQRIMVADLWRFVDDDAEGWDIWTRGDLLNTGLVEFAELEIRIKDEDDWKSSEKYRVEGGELSVNITQLGKKVRAVLRSRRPTTDSKDT